MQLKVALLTIFLCLSACASLPEFPEIEQCGYSVKFNKFRCCNTRTKQCRNIRRDDPSMEAAQCTSADDFKKASNWIKSVEDYANQHCH